ncbi:MAG: hypothetical protein AB1899_07410 [Pseudomonadota bacterium]
MKPSQARIAPCVLIVSAFTLTWPCPVPAAAEGEPAIAGEAPYRRPQDAPSVTAFTRDAAWYRQALTGVSRPYPASLRFLEDQGRWHTPFTRPGMTGPYDIRNWHQPAQADGNQDVARR